MSNNPVEPPSCWKEARRRAWELIQEGWQQKDIAAARGVSKGSVSQEVSKARAAGVPALRRHKLPESPPDCPTNSAASGPNCSPRVPPPTGLTRTSGPPAGRWGEPPCVWRV